jgi:hypothetical protein
VRPVRPRLQPARILCFLRLARPAWPTPRIFGPRNLTLDLTHSGATTDRQTSIAECAEQLTLADLAFVTTDEGRRLVRCDQLPECIH